MSSKKSSKNTKTNPVTHQIAHDLSPELAEKAGRKAINGYAKQHSQLTGRWETPTLYRLEIKVPFSKLTGFVKIKEHAIVFHIDHVPSMFAGFVSKAVDVIDESVKLTINKTKLEQKG